jgi:hypothetical protein
MILVDTSVWVDYFHGKTTPQTDHLDTLLGAEPLAIGDLILTEILQGIASDREFHKVRELLASLQLMQIGGTDIAVAAANNFRALRAKGVTVSKTIDTIIATRCIQDGHELLHCDRDFDGFERHLGLRRAVRG